MAFVVLPWLALNSWVQMMLPQLQEDGTTEVHYCAWLMQIFFFFGIGVWNSRPTLKPLHQPFFVVGFFKIGSWELFA
jgi:hypothetical protein